VRPSVPPAGSWLAGFRTAGRTELRLDDRVAMSHYRLLLAEKFPNSQDADYLKRAQLGRGS
jgi:hypothetical protein